MREMLVVLFFNQVDSRLIMLILIRMFSWASCVRFHLFITAKTEKKEIKLQDWMQICLFLFVIFVNQGLNLTNWKIKQLDVLASCIF